MWAKYWPAIRRLFVSLPFYPIFWCLFSSLVQRRWKSNVFPARIKWHFTPMKTHLGLTNKDLMLNVQTNKQKSRYGKDFLTRVWSDALFPVRCRAQLLFVDCKMWTNNKEHQFCNLFPSDLGWNRRGKHSNVCKWQPNSPRRLSCRRSLLPTFTTVHVLLLAAGSAC